MWHLRGSTKLKPLVKLWLNLLCVVFKFCKGIIPSENHVVFVFFSIY